MSKNNLGTVLMIISMIIAIGSLSLSGYMFWLINQPIEPDDHPITEIWYDSRESEYAISEILSTIPDIELTITVNEGEKVFITFDCSFVIDPTATSGGALRLLIDEFTIIGANRTFYGDTSGYHYESITLQDVVNDLSAGTHIIKIQAASTGAPGIIRSMNLLAYTFL